MKEDIMSSRFHPQHQKHRWATMNGYLVSAASAAMIIYILMTEWLW